MQILWAFFIRAISNYLLWIRIFFEQASPVNGIQVYYIRRRLVIRVQIVREEHLRRQEVIGYSFLEVKVFWWAYRWEVLLQMSCAHRPESGIFVEEGKRRSFWKVWYSLRSWDGWSRCLSWPIARKSFSFPVLRRSRPRVIWTITRINQRIHAVALFHHASILLESTILCLLNDIQDLSPQTLLDGLDFIANLGLEGASNKAWKHPAEEVFIIGKIC